MKHLTFITLACIALIACKEAKQNDRATVETKAVAVPTIPNATFLTETLELTHCESAVYDTVNDRIYASLIGNSEKGDGAIATVGIDGTLINSSFIGGLEDPKGIAITKDRLFVSDVTVLVEADLKTGKILKRHSAPGIQFLNDVAIAPDGSIYVSDTRTSEIYKLATDGNFSLWLANEQLDRPNGLLIQGNTMYVASWGSAPEGGRVSKIDMTTQVITPITAIIGNLDGIRPFDDNHFLISDWNSGKTHLMAMDGSTEEVVQVGQSVGDIAYIKDKKLLLLPMNKQSRLLFYRLE
jgi:DNA-binding beta-propeller fold protein YncE